MAILELALVYALHGRQFQFVQHGFFVAGRMDYVQEAKPVFNLAVGLWDSWGNS